jgi:hypothetical protein
MHERPTFSDGFQGTYQNPFRVVLTYESALKGITSVLERAKMLWSDPCSSEDTRAKFLFLPLPVRQMRVSFIFAITAEFAKALLNPELIGVSIK